MHPDLCSQRSGERRRKGLETHCPPLCAQSRPCSRQTWEESEGHPEASEWGGPQTEAHSPTPPTGTPLAVSHQPERLSSFRRWGALELGFAWSRHSCSMAGSADDPQRAWGRPPVELGGLGGRTPFPFSERSQGNVTTEAKRPGIPHGMGKPEASEVCRAPLFHAPGPLHCPQLPFISRAVSFWPWERAQMLPRHSGH